MVAIHLPDALAARLEQIASQQNRSVEEVISVLVDQYAHAPVLDEIDYALEAMGVVTLPKGSPTPPPLTPDERRALADRVGAAGSLSELVIQERQEGP